MNGVAVPAATTVATATSTVTAPTSVNLEEDEQRDVVLAPTVVGVETTGRLPSKWGRLWWFVFSAGMLLVLTGLAQVILASVIREKDIEILDHWYKETSYPLAGDPYVGVLSLSVAFCFICAVGCQRDLCGGRKGCFEFGAFAVLFVCLIISIGERAVYKKLSEYDTCVEVTGPYVIHWEGECVCLEDGWILEIEPDDDSVGNQAVNVDISSSMSCGRILGYVDGIVASYALMNVLMVLIVLVALLHCTGMASFASTPHFAASTAGATAAAAPTTTATALAPYTVHHVTSTTIVTTTPSYTVYPAATAAASPSSTTVATTRPYVVQPATAECLTPPRMV